MRSGHSAPPRFLRGWRPPEQGWSACPGEIERKPSFRCTPRWNFTSSNTAAEMAQSLPSPSQRFGGNGPSHRTTDPSLRSQHHQTGSSALSHQLRVCGFFLAPRFLQSHAGAPCGSPPRTPIPPERKHKRDVVLSRLCAHKVCFHLTLSCSRFLTALFRHKIEKEAMFFHC